MMLLLGKLVALHCQVVLFHVSIINNREDIERQLIEKVQTSELFTVHLDDVIPSFVELCL